MDWNTIAALAGILGPLVGVPMSAMTLYLRSIKENQERRERESLQRFCGLESQIREIERQMGEFERQYTTKEEWLRETMLARRQLERLMEMMAKVQARLESSDGLAAQIGRATAAMVDLARGLMQAAEAVGSGRSIGQRSS